jgi:hypothetical protein
MKEVNDYGNMIMGNLALSMNVINKNFNYNKIK